MCYMYESRSKDYGDDYDDPGGGEPPRPITVRDILLFPFKLVLGILAFILVCTFMAAAPYIYFLYQIFLAFKSNVKSIWLRLLVLLGLGIALGLLFANQPPAPPAPPPLPTPAGDRRTVEILVDDFSPQPYQGETVYYYNRLEGDRGALNDSLLSLQDGQMATTIASGKSWGGGWMSLNHPIREAHSINFSAILPEQILPAYQSQITGIKVGIARGTPGRVFRLELKNGDRTLWSKETRLQGQAQDIHFDLPALGDINQLVWVLDKASPGDSVVLDRISFTATTSITDTATAAFVWSYGMLLNNWNAATGLVRDKAKDASGEFDAIQATGCLAAATAVAQQLGIVGRDQAVQVVNKISDTLLLRLPRFYGLWPHWVKAASGGKFTIVESTEWSTVDTAIAAIGLLEAQTSLGLDTSGTQKMLQGIASSEPVISAGISHGYTYSGEIIPYAWDTFGGESWLVDVVYAGVTGHLAPLAYTQPPTANGSGFIDELAWLFVAPPQGLDTWDVDWTAYREKAAEAQIAYYPTHAPGSCFASLGLFGLSAGEVPAPALVPQAQIYQAFGIGGRFTASANDGQAVQGAPVVLPHYAAMVASLHPQEAIKMWDWLIKNGHFSPLNNVESLLFTPGSGCGASSMVWNQLKGSWNLALQTLGWGRYLAQQAGKTPALWQAAAADPFLARGNLLLSSHGAISTPSSTPASWTLTRECEYPDASTVGQMIWRSEASGQKVHGQFGTADVSPWDSRPGYVVYGNIDLPQGADLILKLRYSKYSPSTVPILVYLDRETTPRASFFPADQGSWDQFTWSDPISLGFVDSGVHAIKFFTNGQQYGVADLDEFVLTIGSSPATPAPTAISPIATIAPTLPFTPTLASARVYFTVYDTLYRMNLDGSNLEAVTVGVYLSGNFAVNAAQNKLYLSRWDRSGQILAVDLLTQQVSQFSDGPVEGGSGIAVDPSDHKMYLGLYYAGVFVRDLDNSGGWEPVVVSAQLSPMLGQRGQLQIDPAMRRIYFRTAFNGDCGECRYIWRVDFDGSQLAKIIRANGGDCLALDLAAGKLYFSDVPGDYTIKRSNLDGSDEETVLTIPRGYDFCNNMALDVAHQKIYMSLYDVGSHYTRRAIARANIDGSGYENIYQIERNGKDQVSGGMALYLP